VTRYTAYRLVPGTYLKAPNKAVVEFIGPKVYRRSRPVFFIIRNPINGMERAIGIAELLELEVLAEDANEVKAVKVLYSARF
jgi:hypothetical protein